MAFIATSVSGFRFFSEIAVTSRCPSGPPSAELTASSRAHTAKKARSMSGRIFLCIIESPQPISFCSSHGFHKSLVLQNFQEQPGTLANVGGFQQIADNGH